MQNDNQLDYLNVDHQVINLMVVDVMDEMMNLVLNYLINNVLFKYWVGQKKFIF